MLTVLCIYVGGMICEGTSVNGMAAVLTILTLICLIQDIVIIRKLYKD